MGCMEKLRRNMVPSKSTLVIYPMTSLIQYGSLGRRLLKQKKELERELADIEEATREVARTEVNT